MLDPPMETQSQTPQAASERPPPSASRRREKPQLSCNPCRRRKSKCDRQKPCALCSARGQICTYADNQIAQPAGPSAPRTAAGAQDRLVQLERLVMSMIPDGAVNPKLEPSPDGLTVPVDGSEYGSMRISSSELHYVGGDHWAAILDGIADLKDHFDREEQLRLAASPDPLGDEPLPQSRSRHAFLLYGCRRPTSRDEILAALPPKSAVDRYISRYFNYLDLVSSSTVHGPTFLREYEAFWANPPKAPIIWIGLLFSMICLACLTSDIGDGLDAEQQSLQADLYREKTAQCLVMGEYTKGGPYVLEAVINYVYAEFCTRTDADKDMWFLLALEVNLAMQMGYHRDPSHFPAVSPFQGEMRRRVWATVLMGDILVSSQMGMPRMISDWQCDTAEPRNLNDANFDEDSVELPPPRPEDECTTALGIIARRRLLTALGRVADLTASVKPYTYAEVMEVDALLNKAAESVPPPLKMKPMAVSITDSPQTIVARMFIRHMFYKGQIMLHRRVLYTPTPSQNQSAFDYSWKSCLDASLGTLEIQHILDEETCPGGQLHTMRWRVTSIMNNLFLTATMILCSLLSRGQTLQREDEIRGAVQRARTIWMRRRDISAEARKAADTVSIVLTRAGGKDMNSEIGGQGFHENLIERPDGHIGVDFSEGGMLAEADEFLMPGFLGPFLPNHLQGDGLGTDGYNSFGSPEGWMPTGSTERRWWQASD